MDVLNRNRVINSGRIFILDIVRNRTDCSSQDFTRSCLGKLIHENDSDQRGKSTDISSNLGVDFFLKIGDLLIGKTLDTVTLEDHISEGTLTLDGIVVTNNS